MRTHEPGGAGVKASGSDFVQSLERGLAVIQAFSATRPRLTLSDVARQTGIDPGRCASVPLDVAAARVRRQQRPRVLPDPADPPARVRVPVVHTVLGPCPGPHRGTGRPAPRVVLDQRPRPRRDRVRRPSADEADHDDLARRRQPAAGVRHVDGPRDAGGPPRRADRRVPGAGRADPAHQPHGDRSRARCERSLLEVREQGWALVDQELEDGVRSIAAALRGADGRVLGALNVSAHATRTNLDALAPAVPPRTPGDHRADQRRSQPAR